MELDNNQHGGKSKINNKLITVEVTLLLQLSSKETTNAVTGNVVTGVISLYFETGGAVELLSISRCC